MFTSRLKTVFIACAVLLGTLLAANGPANAGKRADRAKTADISVGVTLVGKSRYHKRRHYRPKYHKHRSYRHRRIIRSEPRRLHRRSLNRCNPRKALHKARRKGLRRAHIVRVNRRGVVVAGRKWGRKMVMKFNPGKRCRLRQVARAHYY